MTTLKGCGLPIGVFFHAGVRMRLKARFHGRQKSDNVTLPRLGVATENRFSHDRPAVVFFIHGQPMGG